MYICYSIKKLVVFLRQSAFSAFFFKSLVNTLILHIQTVKPRVSLIQVAEPSVWKLFCTTKWVVQNDHQNAPTEGSATYNAKSG